MKTVVKLMVFSSLRSSRRVVQRRFNLNAHPKTPKGASALFFFCCRGNERGRGQSARQRRRRRCRTRVVREDERSAERPNARRRRGARREAVATDGRDERIEREPLDRGPSPHVSCQAKARVPICAPKDRFTRVLAASFTGAPRYTREVFILGSRSSRVFVRRRHSKK